MKKVLFLLTACAGLLGSNLSAQAPTLPACPAGAQWTSNGSGAPAMTVAIVGSTTGVPLVASAAVTSNFNGYGVSCALASTGNNSNGIVTVTTTGGSTTGTVTPSYDIYQASTVSGAALASNGTGTFASLLGTNNGAGTAGGTQYIGVYTDANGCKDTTAVVSVIAPYDLLAGTCMTADLCQINAAQVQVAAAGGVANGSSNGGLYSGAANYGLTWSAFSAISPMTVGTAAAGTGPSSITAASGAGTALVTGLSGNVTYKFVVTDANGCTVQ